MAPDGVRHADTRSVPARARRLELFGVATLCLALIGMVDYLTGPEIAFALFYASAIAIAAWATSDVRLAIASSIIGGLIWLAAEWLARDSVPHMILLWNATTRLAIFAAIGVLICRLRRALDLAHALARTDYVTGVLNVRAFHEIAQIEISRARRYGHALTLAYFDVDDFKTVNDRFGHTRGDEILRAVAGTLRASLRRSDTVARVGGDEFVVLLPETGRGEAQDALAKLQGALAEALGATDHRVTLSIGAAVFEVPPADVDALIGTADALMYAAKAEGKNRISVSVAAPAVVPARSWQAPPGAAR